MTDQPEVGLLVPDEQIQTVHLLIECATATVDLRCSQRKYSILALEMLDVQTMGVGLADEEAKD